MSFFILLCLPSSIEMSHIAFLNALWLIVQPLWVLKHLNERMRFGTEDVKTHEIETFLICCSQERFVLSQTGKMSLQDLLGREAKWSYLFDWPSKQHSDAVLFWACIPLLFKMWKTLFSVSHFSFQLLIASTENVVITNIASLPIQMQSMTMFMAM